MYYSIYFVFYNYPPNYSLKLYATNLTNNPFLNISGTASYRLSGINLQWGEDYGSVHMAIEKLIKSLRASFNDHESKERNTPMRDDLKSDLPDEEARKEKTLLLRYDDPMQQHL